MKIKKTNKVLCMSEPFFCKVCNMNIHFMTTKEHNNGLIHKRNLSSKTKLSDMYQNDTHCATCDMHLSFNSIPFHIRSIKHMIMTKRSLGENVDHDYYLCKICNIEVKWKNLYLHEARHGMHNDDKYMYKNNRIKEYCGLCKASVYKWKIHTIGVKHNNELKLKTGK